MASPNSSDAYRGLLAALEMSGCLLELDKKNFKNPPRRNEERYVVGLRGGAAVLAVAAFEQFLKDLFEENIERLVPGGAVFDKLPDRMRVTAVYNALNMSLKGENEYGGKAKKVDRLPKTLYICRRLGAGVLDASAFCRTYGNPNPENVKAMFSSVGIEDLFGTIKDDFEKKWRKKESASFVRDKLDEIVKRRHVVAHTADALAVTRAQLNETNRFLKVLGFVLERLLRKHIADVIRISRKT